MAGPVLAIPWSRLIVPLAQGVGARPLHAASSRRLLNLRQKASRTSTEASFGPTPLMRAERRDHRGVGIRLILIGRRQRRLSLTRAMASRSALTAFSWSMTTRRRAISRRISSFSRGPSERPSPVTSSSSRWSAPAARGSKPTIPCVISKPLMRFVCAVHHRPGIGVRARAGDDLPARRWARERR